MFVWFNGRHKCEQTNEFGPLSGAFYSYVIHENIQNYICMKGTMQNVSSCKVKCEIEIKLNVSACKTFIISL